MPEDLFIPVEKVVKQTEQVGVTVREIAMVFPDTETAGVLAIVLAPKDDAGKWREDVETVRVRIVDDLESEQPQERYRASLFLNLLLSATVTDTPEHQALGIVGMSVKDASKVLLPSFLAP